MELSVVHETSYAYASPVLLSQQLLHLTPRALPRQRVHAHRIDLDPRPSECSSAADYFGNAVTRALFTSRHRALTVRVESRVGVEPRGADPLAGPSTPWESARDRLSSLDAPPALEPTEFVFESPRVEVFTALTEYAAPSFAPGRPLLAGAADLMRRIHADFEFDRSATSVATPLREVLATRRGVCQDFAHLMIGALRGLGLPARYVSGYILTTPPPGHARLVGADASHAWVSVYDPAAGWVDFDPTNECLADDEHVTLAWGRDFGDVTPMRGVILGGGEQTLKVHVTVAPVESAHG
jgi:transglutaminase-like putative cysteine protease